jgi:2-polyprenyl-3-methyl-5-hydroxy-6-metoxy-1,4-benzoquinol methylase
MTASAFSPDQYADAYPPGSEHGYWALVRNRLIADALGEARDAGLWDGAGPILEIGCGVGIVVSALRQRGFDAWGVDLAAPPVLAGVAPYVSLGCDAGDLAPTFRDQVTVLLLLDVIEHIAEPVPFLEAVAKSFPRCRCFVVTVPARAEVWSNYDEYYGHHRRYDRPSLARTLREAGLMPRTLSYFFRPLYAAALILAIARRKRAVLMQSPRRLGVHRALAAALYGIERMLHPVPALPGLSLMAIAVRPLPREAAPVP